ncbi:SCP2 sterol-binding domain-containing protein [Mechercharimyces sp. CAU 1602]|nr:SCP2 sterol-binding domain-containing protein [Mechercharimyces sp. CAU 1602]
MEISSVFAELTQKVNENPEGIQGVNAIYQFDLDEGGTYQIQFADGKAEQYEGTPLDAQCTMRLSEKNFAKLVQGELNPTMAFMSGKLKIDGDLSLAMKLQSILKNYQ